MHVLMLLLLLLVLASDVIAANVTSSRCDQPDTLCMRHPGNCIKESCDWTMTSLDVGAAFDIELSARVTQTNSWVAFGLSTDEKMGYDSVVDCIHNDVTGHVTVQLSWNGRGIDNDPVPDTDLILVPGTVSGSYTDQYITCRFHRLKQQQQQLNGTQRDNRIFPLDSEHEYFILMARGPAMKGVKYYHNKRIRSEAAVNFSDVMSLNIATVEDHSKRLDLVKAHGILMVFAWMVFASFGALMPRYCKPAWTENLWCGKKIWFQIHRTCMSLTVILTGIGFILVFVAVKRYSHLTSPTVAHPPLGIIVLICTIVNPIMALFRPEPDAKNRPIFNVLHFTVGFLAHLFAVITLFLAMYMVLPDLQQFVWCRAVMATFICFHAAIEFTLALHLHRDKLHSFMHRPSLSVQQSAPTKDKQNENRFKTLILVLHFVGVLSFAVAIAVQIGNS